MSWMDSWSRPSKSQATPAPFYLIPGSEATPYCHSCGRVISSRKAQTTSSTATPVKFCSARCRNNKPSAQARRIEEAFVALLSGAEAVPESEHAGVPAYSKKGKGGKRSKGDPRILVPCTAVEMLVFGDRYDPEKVYGRRRDRKMRGVQEKGEWKSVDMVDDDEDDDDAAGVEDKPVAGPPRISYPPPRDAGSASRARTSTDNASTSSDGGGGASVDDEAALDGDVLARLSIRSGTRIRPAQDVSEVNGGVGGEKGWAEKVEETAEMAEKRREGQRRAEEREMVRCAARRGVAFGFLLEAQEEAGKGARAREGVWEGQRRLCEAVMLGKVVESSFAKGDWSVRWRE